MSPLVRKNCWQLAEEAGDLTPDGLQRLLRSSKWDADGALEDTQDYVVEHFGDREAVLAIHEVGFPKKGDQSVGVQRQPIGDKVENCQVGIFLGYMSPKGCALIDRALYLPESWANDAARRKKTGVPEGVPFKTKPKLAREMLDHALGRGIPAAWVTGDEVYGLDIQFRHFLEDRGRSYVLAVPSPHDQRLYGQELVTASELAAKLPASIGRSEIESESAIEAAGGGWAARELDAPNRPGFAAWHLIHQGPTPKREMTYYQAFAPTDTPIRKLIEAAGSIEAMANGLQRAKAEAGLDQYEARHWTAWHRHMTLAMLAFAYLEAQPTRRWEAAEAVGFSGEGA